MIHILVRYAHAIGVSTAEQVFYVCGTADNLRNKYECPGLPADRLKLKRKRKLDLSLLEQLGEKDLLILHSAFYEDMWRSLLKWPRILKNTALIHWGAEVPAYRGQTHLIKKQLSSELRAKCKRNFLRLRCWKFVLKVFLRAGKILRILISHQHNKHLRSLILPRLGAIVTGTPGEFEMINQLHGPCHNYIPLKFLTNTTDLKPSLQKEHKAALKVLLGNSGKLTNEHLEVLSWLSAFKDENIQVICPLGYPQKSSYKDEVIKTGKRLLQDKFVPLIGMIPKPEYNSLLESIDVFILNAKRQQGAYCVFSSLLSGKKVYLSTVSPFYQMFVDWGIKVFDVRDIARLSFQEFSSFSLEDAKKNHKIGQEHFSLQASLKSYKALIAKIKDGTNEREIDAQKI